GCQRHADRCIPASREGPVQCAAQIINAPRVVGEPFGGGPRFPFGFGPLRDRQTLFGEPAGDLFALTALRELAKRISAHRVQQPITSNSAACLHVMSDFATRLARPSTTSDR